MVKEMFANKHDDLSSISDTHMVEGENSEWHCTQPKINKYRNNNKTKKSTQTEYLHFGIHNLYSSALVQSGEIGSSHVVGLLC